MLAYVWYSWAYFNNFFTKPGFRASPTPGRTPVDRGSRMFLRHLMEMVNDYQFSSPCVALSKTMIPPFYRSLLEIRNIRLY